MTGASPVQRSLAIRISLVVLGALFASEARAADDDTTGDPRIAIQRRKYQMAHEVRLSVGAMPVDAFQKGWTGSLSYTTHFNDYVAWELFQVTGALLTSTNLRDLLIDTFAVAPQDFAAPRFVATTGLELTPIYGKQAFLNDSVLHQSLLLGAYAGVIFGDRGDLGDTFSDFRPAVGGGIGYRLFLSKSVSMRVDLRELISFRRAIRQNESVSIDHSLMINVGFGFNLWRDDA